MARKYKRKCLFPDCNTKETSRGLCQNHYGTALRMVKKKQVTWEKLEASGKTKPAKLGCIKKNVTPAMSWFTVKSSPTKTIKPKVQEEPKFMMVRNEDTVEAEERNHLQLVHSEQNKLIRSQLARLSKLFTDNHTRYSKMAKLIQRNMNDVQKEYDSINNDQTT